MKKRSRILSFMLACIFAIGCTSFAVTSVLAEEETTLFYESFDLATYSSTTEYNGKAGAWTVTGTNAAHDAANGTIYISNSSTSAQWQFDFTEQYEGAMKLKVTAEILTGYTGADSMMSIHLMSNDHNNVLGLCTFDGGNIYANALDSNSATAAYNTGASYELQHLYTVTGIIDQENESFLLSVYDNTADSAVLTDFNVPYKHKKENYAKMTSGFQTVRVNAKRVKNQKGYELKDFSVKQIISDPPVSDYLFNEGFESSGYASTTVYNGKAGAWTLTGSGHGYDSDTSIYVQNGNNNATWQFDFTEQYEGAMKLEAVAEIEAGSTESGLRMRIDLMSDAGVLGLCTFEGGTIYANVLDANAATAEYNTGASYVSGHIYTVTGIIDEAKESFLLS
ncbi:MAG: hypothetical protein K5768_02690, partial [Firmicutes bacterium]|nr:hypothetical protein [Bacillota bacterium]